MAHIALLCDEHTMEAQPLGQQLGIPVIQQADPQYDYWLVPGQQPEIILSRDPKQRLSIDFNTAALTYKKRQSWRRFALARACGAGRSGTLLDCTAGLGQDAFLLAHWGFQVTMLEQSPIIAYCLAQAMQNLTVELSWRLLPHEALSYLQQTKLGFDVIYFDPMYPASTKTALHKQRLRLLAEVVQQPQHFSKILATARAQARRRVVVKRPVSASALAPPDWVVAGKTVRFDVYRGHYS